MSETFRHRLRSINPQNGYITEFNLRKNVPILVGRLTLDQAIGGLRGILKKIPHRYKRRITEYIEDVKQALVMRDCKINNLYISRAHCIIFPSEKTQIVDLFSKNGTWIAGEGKRISSAPGKKRPLKPGDLILLARGQAIFQLIDSESEDESRLFGDLEESPDSYLEEIRLGNPSGGFYEGLDSTF